MIGTHGDWRSLCSAIKDIKDELRIRRFHNEYCGRLESSYDKLFELKKAFELTEESFLNHGEDK